MKSTLILPVLFLVFLLSACQKYLDIKPDKEMVVPSKLSDLQAILDNSNKMNILYSSSGEAASDNYYISFSDWEALSLTDRNIYIWDREVFNDTEVTDWSSYYEKVYYANVVLDNLSKVSGSGSEKEQVRGQALFFRSLAFFDLLQLYALPYSEDPSAKYGIALRLTSDLNVRTTRASLEDSYQQVLRDLLYASKVLPAVSSFPTRPSQAAAYALLSRVYLSMRAYPDALKYADSALSIQNQLLDFNELSPAAAYPVPPLNREVIFHSLMKTRKALNPSRGMIDTTLIKTYATDDLRKQIFFRVDNSGAYVFKGSYYGYSDLTNALTTDELYLNRAECLARGNKVAEAASALNALLSKRWKTGRFQPLSFTSGTAALNTILEERRKELVMRGLRWTDLRRLNLEPDHQVTLKRKLNGEVYLLLPNDPRYVFPIPDKVISMTGMPQNH